MTREEFLDILELANNPNYILCSINVQLDNNAEIKVLKNELNRRINRDSRTDA